MDSISNDGRASNPLKVNVPTHEGQVSLAFTRGGARQGAGRKPIGETRKVSITLTPQLWEQLDQRCGQQGQSRSEWLRGIIEDALAGTGTRIETGIEAGAGTEAEQTLESAAQAAPAPEPSPQQQHRQQAAASSQLFAQQQQ